MLAWGDLRIVPFSCIVHEFDERDVLVINNSKVMKARFFAECERTGRIHEVLFTMPLGAGLWEAMIHNTKKLACNDRLLFGKGTAAALVAKTGNTNRLRIEDGADLFELMEKSGTVPLPPYIKRADGDGSVCDEARYQTVYSKEYGSSAAPTAGLHFTRELMEALKQKGVTVAETTLHVGPGTFLPVKTEKISGHRMHSERFEMSDETAAVLNDARKAGRRITAAGTTSLRVLETCLRDGSYTPGRGMTDIFIYPPCRVYGADRLITNFHLPGSTLLMLVSAFAGIDLIKRAYAHAISNRMRFYSYGDAMLLNRETN